MSGCACLRKTADVRCCELSLYVRIFSDDYEAAALSQQETTQWSVVEMGRDTGELTGVRTPSPLREFDSVSSCSRTEGKHLTGIG